MRIEKKYNYDSRGGCLRMAVIILIAAVLIAAVLISMVSCAPSRKNGCGTENYKHKFNS